MPLKIDARDRKLLIGALCLLVLVIAATVLFGGEGGQKLEIPSSYSTASSGAKAAYLMLAQSGYNVQRWEKPISELPQQSRATLIIAGPVEAPTRSERKRLKEFLANGGRVIATRNVCRHVLARKFLSPRLSWGRVEERFSNLAFVDYTGGAEYHNGRRSILAALFVRLPVVFSGRAKRSS